MAACTKLRPKVESASAAALLKADVNLASAAKTRLDHSTTRNILEGPELFLYTETPSADVLLLNLPLVRLSAIYHVAKELGKQGDGTKIPKCFVTLLWSDEIDLHWVIVVNAGIANIDTCQAKKLLNLVCLHSVIPQHLPAHPAESSVRVRHQPAAEFLPSWLDRPRISCKREQT